jgi:hypothetical protein
LELTLNADSAQGEIDVFPPEGRGFPEPQSGPGCEKHQRPNYDSSNRLTSWWEHVCEKQLSQEPYGELDSSYIL